MTSPSLASLHPACADAGAAADRARRGRLAGDRGWQAHPRRHLLLVGDHPWPSPSRHRRRHQGTGGKARSGDFRRLHPSAGRRSGARPARHRAARSDACLLFRQRLDRGGSGAENGAGLLAATSGKPRQRIIALEHAYHGDTIGTMSAGARGVFNAAYEPLLFDVERLPFPAPGREQETLDALERLRAQTPPP